MTWRELELELQLQKARSARIVRQFEEDRARRLGGKSAGGTSPGETFTRMSDGYATRPSRAEVSVFKRAVELLRLARAKGCTEQEDYALRALRRVGWEPKGVA